MSLCMEYGDLGLVFVFFHKKDSNSGELIFFLGNHVNETKNATWASCYLKQHVFHTIINRFFFSKTTTYRYDKVPSFFSAPSVCY